MIYFEPFSFSNVSITVYAPVYNWTPKFYLGHAEQLYYRQSFLFNLKSPQVIQKERNLKMNCRRGENKSG